MAYEGSTHLGDHFRSRRERGMEGLPTMSVTLNDGLVPRDSLVRNTKTNLSPSEHLLVRKGDIAFNMMRMWQGASGLAHNDGIVSPAYVVLEPRESIDSKFASYLFKHPRLIYLFWAYSYGLTKDRLRLYFPDFSRIPVDLPDLGEQKKIARIIETWDGSISTLERQLANSKRKKTGLMQRLISGRQRLPGSNGEWMHAKLGDVVEISTGTSKRRYINDVGSRYIIDMGSVDRNGVLVPTKKTDFQEALLKLGQLVMPKDDIGGGLIIGRVGYIDSDEKYVLGDHVYVLDVHGCDSRFLNYLINSFEVNKSLRRKANGTAQLGLGRKDVCKQPIFIPSSRKEQEEIAGILRSVELETEALTNRLRAMRIERRGLMQQLLTGKRRVTVDKEAA